MAKKVFKTTVYTGIDKDGKKTRETVRASSKRELDKKVRAIKDDVARNKDLLSNATFGYWADRWYEDLKEPSGLAPATLTQIRSSLLPLREEFGDKEFKDIRFADFQSFINDYTKTPTDRTGKPPSKRTIKAVVAAFNNVAEYAAENDIPAAVPFKKTAINKNAPVKKRRALTETEINRIWETEHDAQCAALIMIFAGLRRGELVPLRWSDIDLERGIIDLKRFCYVEHSQFVEKEEGKTDSARRRIPLPPALVDYLIEYRRSGKATSVFVCPKQDGSMHSPASFRRMWERYLKLLNYKYGFEVPHDPKETVGKKDLPMRIKPFSPHECRHSYATILFWEDVPVQKSMQLLGHSDIEMTANTYTDLAQSPFDFSETFKEQLRTIYKIQIA